MFYLSRMKYIFVAIFLFITQFANANMASPYRDGTRSTSAISSKNISVLSEKIYIKIDPDFNEAHYTIEYSIKSDYFGEQIPLLFIAEDFQRDFKVWYDDKPIEVLNYKGEGSNFSDVIQTEEGNTKIKVAWDKHKIRSEYIGDLKYFKTNIQKGIHQIKVTYIARNWTYLDRWISEKTFRYSLVPAKYWKSFGKLELTIEQQGNEKYTVNFDDKVIEKQIKTWKFDSLPSDYLKIKLKPKISTFAKILLFFKPFVLSLIPILLLVFFHYRLTLIYRKKKLLKRFSIVVILGSIIIPFLGFLAYIGAINLIDFSLGIYASKRHGYIFLVIIFYPIVLLFYWLLFWLIDKGYKKKMMLKNTMHNGFGYE